MHVINFNQTCQAWSPIKEHNAFYVVKTIDYLMDMLRQRNYIYSNQIYEAFGAPWNPDFENVCYRDVNDFFVGYHEDSDGDYNIEFS